MKLKRTSYPITILGLTEKTTTSKNYVSVRLQSSSNPNSSIKITCSLVPKITTSTPPLSPIAILTDPLLQDKAPVADPSLGGKVDILLGAHHTDLCITGPTVMSESTLVHATPTIFGRTIVAPLDSVKPQPVLKIEIKEDTLQQSIQKLLELEQIPATSTLSSDDQRAVEQFQDTYRVQSDGRYVVKLPRPPHPRELGDSKAMATKRFHQNERTP